ncbi:MAG: ribosomal RNA small subunit methyltransferase A [Candidatus Pacebacteria bacterium]|nr:ribosomal RNA small subunit methyltransferase A [Candidatus Paceibacterota bacterium]
MNLCSKIFVENLLKENNIYPSKKLGQNFLLSKTVLNKIIETGNIKKTDIILEIGAGIGTLTKELAKNAKKVIAIEKDKRLIKLLKENLKEFNNVYVINNDVLKTDIRDYKLKTKNYKLISNLPYYITSPIIRKFLEIENPPYQMILMVQKQVAQRITAKPPDMNLLAVSVQFYSETKIISYVSKDCFYPKPKVDSAIIQLTINNKQQTINKKLFFKIVKAGFSHPRKQLANNLSKELKLDKQTIKKWFIKNNISPKQRSETLNIKDWINLTKSNPKL